MSWQIGTTIGVNKGDGKATCIGFEGNEAIFQVDNGETIRLPYTPTASVSLETASRRAIKRYPKVKKETDEDASDDTEVSETEEHEPTEAELEKIIAEAEARKTSIANAAADSESKAKLAALLG